MFYLVLLFSFSALACPNLQGVYQSCDTEDELMTVNSIDQSQDAAGVTTYVINNNNTHPLVADGIVYTEVADAEEEGDGLIKVEFLTKCMGKKTLTWSMTTKFPGLPVHKYSITYSKKGDVLTIAHKGYQDTTVVKCK